MIKWGNKILLQGLHAINLGDSGFVVIRDGCTIFHTPVQQHDFNFTFQLANGNEGDQPSSGQVSSPHHLEIVGWRI